MSGLAKLCKLYGGMKVTAKGETVEYVYDYAKDKPRRKRKKGKKEGKEIDGMDKGVEKKKTEADGK